MEEGKAETARRINREIKELEKEIAEAQMRLFIAKIHLVVLVSMIVLMLHFVHIFLSVEWMWGMLLIGLFVVHLAIERHDKDTK